MPTPVRSTRAPASDDPSQILPHVGRTIWDNVPTSLLGSVLLLIAASPALLVATSGSWMIAWPLLLLCTAPVWTGIVVAGGRLLDGDTVTLPTLLALVRRHAWTGIRIGIVPAIVGMILFGSLHLLDRNLHAGWIVIPLLLDLGVAIVVGTSLVTIFTVSTDYAATGIELWLASAAVTISRPIPVLGTLALFGVVAWVAAMFGPVALIAVAPLGIVCAAVTRDALPAPPASVAHRE